MSEKRSILSYYFAFIIFQILVMLVQWWLGERKRKAEWERERERERVWVRLRKGSETEEKNKEWQAIRVFVWQTFLSIWPDQGYSWLLLLLQQFSFRGWIEKNLQSPSPFKLLFGFGNTEYCFFCFLFVQMHCLYKYLIKCIDTLALLTTLSNQPVN